MKKILVINTKYKQFGGEDSNFKEEVKFLKQFYDIEVLKFDNSIKLQFIDLIGFFLLTNFLSNKQLKNKLQTFKPDFVYIHNTWFKANLGIFKILKKQNISTILKIHNFRFACTDTFRSKLHFNYDLICYKCGNKRKKLNLFNKYFRNSYLKSFFVILYGKKYIKIMRQQQLKIIVLNSFYFEFLLQKKIDNKKIFVINNPIEVIEHSKYFVNSDYVVYAGSLVKQKGIEELIQAWRDSNINLTLKIVGIGDLETQLKNKYSSTNIEFTGFLENTESLEIIKKSRAVITATKMFEAQPRLLCEASSLGIPSIYPSFGGMDEYFPDDYRLSFEQFNYKDLIKKISLLEDKQLLLQESRKVHEFMLKNMNLAKIKNSFEELLINE